MAKFLSPGHILAIMSKDYIPRDNSRHKNDSVWLRDLQNQNDLVQSGESSVTSSVNQVHMSSSKSQGSTSLAALALKLVENKDCKTSTPSQTLPSLSLNSAALLQLHNQPRSESNTISPPIPSVESLKKKKQSGASNVDVRQNPLHTVRRERDERHLFLPAEDLDEDQNKEVKNEAPSTPPSSNAQRDVRLMFHGREIFAHDLVGLRVAKTFPDYGRFLGQVVKFDTQTSLYTVVYADGDAEDVTIDETLQILIQDEIERADPSQPPPAISLFQTESKEDSCSDTGDFTLPSPRRRLIQVSEREAQFVISLFENHALPKLVHQGWRVQTSTSEHGDTRYISSTGKVFSSPLDVVEHIALNDELLKTCFSPNVHSAILSLLPRDTPASMASSTKTKSNRESVESVPRKRTAFDSPNIGPIEGKRTRHAEETTFAGVPSIHGRIKPSINHHTFHRAEDGDLWSQAASRSATYHSQVVGGHHRMSSNQFTANEDISEARSQTHPILRRNGHASNSHLTLQSMFSNRWPSAEPASGRKDSSPYARCSVDAPAWREEKSVYMSDRQLDAHPRTCMQANGRYVQHFNARDRAGTTEGARSLGASTSFYRESTMFVSGDHEGPGLAYPPYTTIRARMDEHCRPSTLSQTSRVPASFVSLSDTPSAGSSFSMVDVDRVSRSNAHQPRSGQHHTQQAYLHYQPMQLHRRTSTSHYYQSENKRESQYNSESTSEAQTERMSANTASTFSH